MTFKQISSNGGTVKKGETSNPVIFWKIIEREKDNGEIDEIPIIRYYNVFNLDQTEGLDFYDVKNDINTYKDVDEFVNTFNPNIVYGGNESFYIPKEDEIHLPEISNFNSIDDYYHTLFHELSHWTGNPKRLNRPLQSLEKDRKKYAKEELIAELSSYFISTTFGFNVKPKAAGYLKSWLSALDWKPESLIEVSSKAYKVYDYIINRNFV
jgi:antirestriction protein ArdC